MAMQKTAADASTQTDAQAAAFRGLAENGEQALAGWLRSSESAMKGSLDIARQFMSFGAARLEADLTAMKTLMACRDLNDLVKCQQHFAKEAATQYMDQANKIADKLAGLMTEATRDGSARHH